MKLIYRERKKQVLVLLLFIVFFLFFWTQPNFIQSGTIKIWDRNNILLYESAGTVGKKIPVTYEMLPKHLIDATIASEDSSFWTNPGIDVKAIARALFINSKEQRIISGASTITQQLVRASVFSPRQAQSKSILRKIREILIALRLNAFYAKKDILTMYFNQMYYGNLAYGIQAASQIYFGKDVKQLSLAESAYLTGLLSAPDKRNPFIYPKVAKKQQERILDAMVKYAFISPEKASDAKKEKPALVQERQVNIKAPHFAHYVLQEMENLEIKQKGQGINIYTTLDYPTFTLSERIAAMWVERLQKQHDLSNAALVLIKNDTGEIITMLGGIDYYDAQHAGQVNMTISLRQPGSALKPVTYAAAFMQGYTPATLIYDVKQVYKTKKGEGFTPNNYDGQYHGLVLAREALASSLNLPAVEMLYRTGIPNFLKVARDLGITTFNQEERYDLSLTLGGGEVKLLDLTNVFASFARGGIYKPPFAIKSVTTDNGQVLYTHKKEEVPVLGKNGKQIAYLITHILSDPKARIPGFGEKNPLVLSRQAAAKTGTTSDWHDNWTVGFTPSFTVGVWVGNNDNHPMRDITGIVGAAPIWNQFFEEYLKGKPKETFVRPEKIKEVEICKLSGKLVDGICLEKTTELFIEGTEPKEKSTLHKKIIVDTRNSLRADNSCPKEFVQEKIFLDYPQQVYSWAVANNLEVIPEEFSPLCNTKQQIISSSFLQITYPKEKTVFENAPLLVDNQAVVFEMNVSSDISSVSWYVDGKLFKSVKDFPFSASWFPEIGKHTIKAIAQTASKTISSEDVHISVVNYKEKF